MSNTAGSSAKTGPPTAFHYHRSIAPMMWVFVALASIELVVVHFLLALWRPWVALAVSLITLPSLIWLLRTIASFRRLPVMIEDDRLLLRTGGLRSVAVPLSQVAGLRANWTGDDLKGPGVMNPALIAYPNVWIDLSGPVAGRRGPVRAIAHKLDDPEAFAEELRLRLGRALA
jgi:hypothetical protein